MLPPTTPVTSLPGGPVDVPVAAISTRLGVTADQVLLAWAKAKGAIVLTSSSKKTRLQGYIAAGDIGASRRVSSNLVAENKYSRTYHS